MNAKTKMPEPGVISDPDVFLTEEALKQLSSEIEAIAKEMSEDEGCFAVDKEVRKLTVDTLNGTLKTMVDRLDAAAARLKLIDDLEDKLHYNREVLRTDCVEFQRIINGIKLAIRRLS